jgi:hypothetical protein
MATKQDLGKEYAEYLENNAKNKAIAASEIAGRIRKLSYTESKKPLSDKDKNEIVNEIENQLLNKKTKDGRLLVEAVDSTPYIELIKQIRNQVGK